MVRTLCSAGELVEIECEPDWVADLLDEACRGALAGGPRARGSLTIRVESERRPFAVEGWEPLTRGAWRRPGMVVVENACASGFDLQLSCTRERAVFVFRWRPRAAERAASLALRSRFLLLARAALLQYPVLWWAGVHGRPPLHAVVCTAGAATPLLAGPGGVGKSTLLAAELAAGGAATSDNLCVADGRAAWGLVEPMRVPGWRGRRMPHGRVEAAMTGRVPHLAPDRVVVLRRGLDGTARLRSATPRDAARSMVTGTYMAGELRRYWALAATLSAGTGLGPAQPPVDSVAAAFAAGLPCLELVLPARPGPRLADLLEMALREESA
jgi:hypothetical protein